MFICYLIIGRNSALSPLLICAIQSQSGSLETALLSQSCSGHAWQGAYLHGGQPAGTPPQPAQPPPAVPPSPFSGVRRHPAGVQRQSDPGCTAGGVLFCGRGGGAVPTSPAYPGTGRPEPAGAFRVGQSERPAGYRHNYKPASPAG